VVRFRLARKDFEATGVVSIFIEGDVPPLPVPISEQPSLQSSENPNVEKFITPDD